MMCGFLGGSCYVRCRIGLPAFRYSPQCRGSRCRVSGGFRRSPPNTRAGNATALCGLPLQSGPGTKSVSQRTTPQSGLPLRKAVKSLTRPTGDVFKKSFEKDSAVKLRI
jgi:hypothetical protein